MEHFIAKDSGIAVVSKEDGIVKYVDSTKIVTTNNGVSSFPLQYIPPGMFPLS